MVLVAVNDVQVPVVVEVNHERRELAIVRSESDSRTDLGPWLQSIGLASRVTIHVVRTVHVHHVEVLPTVVVVVEEIARPTDRAALQRVCPRVIAIPLGRGVPVHEQVVARRVGRVPVDATVIEHVRVVDAHAVDPDARADLYGRFRERPVTEVLVDLVRIDAGAPVVHLDDIGPTVLIVVHERGGIGCAESADPTDHRHIQELPAARVPVEDVRFALITIAEVEIDPAVAVIVTEVRAEVVGNVNDPALLGLLRKAAHTIINEQLARGLPLHREQIEVAIAVDVSRCKAVAHDRRSEVGSGGLIRKLHRAVVTEVAVWHAIALGEHNILIAIAVEVAASDTRTCHGQTRQNRMKTACSRDVIKNSR